ncbi:MAG: hypothetical protein ACPGXI_17050 [Mycobacterium sp.]
MATLTRRAALAVLATGGGLLGLGYVLRNVIDLPFSRADGPGMGGVASAEMSQYMNMFRRHGELRRSVEDIPGGVRTTTESSAPDLVAELQSHVSAMFSHLDQGAEVMCMSSSLPTLFRRAPDYQRQLIFTANGVVVEETAIDPDLTRTIREHAGEVTGFVVEGMPAMMRGMMDGGMMDGGMMDGGMMDGMHS